MTCNWENGPGLPQKNDCDLGNWTSLGRMSVALEIGMTKIESFPDQESY